MRKKWHIVMKDLYNVSRKGLQREICVGFVRCIGFCNIYGYIEAAQFYARLLCTVRLVEIKQCKFCHRWETRPCVAICSSLTIELHGESKKNQHLLCIKAWTEVASLHSYKLL